MTIAAAQKIWQANSEFADTQQFLEWQYGTDATLSASTTVTTDLFADCLADENCSGIKITYARMIVTVGETHNATNYYEIGVNQVNDSGTTIDSFSFDTGNDVSNMTVANSPLKAVLSTGKTFTFTAATRRFEFTFDESGTATLVAPQILIRYEKVYGSNARYAGATLAA